MDELIPQELRAKIPQLGKAEKPEPMVWVKLSSEALGIIWYIIEMQPVESDAIFYAYIIG
jgi:hypothetical protein